MIKLTPITDRNCQGIEVSITNINELAKAVSLIFIQQYSLAKELLSYATGTTSGDPEEIQINSDDIEDIISRRLPHNNPHHRDGLLYQHIMWLASHLDRQDGDFVSSPHTQCAEKGQDSLILHTSEGTISGISICEDKATENPRNVIRDDVWTEFKKYEEGNRRDELRSGIIDLLGRSGISDQEAQSMVRKISWEGKRRYRVRITIEGVRSRYLFKGFSEIVPGEILRRRGETTCLPSMRQWMNNFSELVISELRRFSTAST